MFCIAGILTIASGVLVASVEERILGQIPVFLD
jgi:hypothetical protein